MSQSQLDVIQGSGCLTSGQSFLGHISCNGLDMYYWLVLYCPTTHSLLLYNLSKLTLPQSFSFDQLKKVPFHFCFLVFSSFLGRVSLKNPLLFILFFRLMTCFLSLVNFFSNSRYFAQLRYFQRKYFWTSLLLGTAFFKRKYLWTSIFVNYHISWLTRWVSKGLANGSLALLTCPLAPPSIFTDDADWI